MSRRKFLRSGAVVAGGSLLGSQTVYGTAAAQVPGPAVADVALSLPLDRTGLPVEANKTFSAVAGFFAKLDSDRAFAALFSRDPQAALSQASLSGTLDKDDIVVDVMRAALDPSMKAMIKTADYGKFIGEMKRRGYLNLKSRSALQEQFEGVLKRDYDKFKAGLNEVFSSRPQLAELLLREEKLNSVVRALESDSKEYMAATPFATSKQTTANAALSVDYVNAIPLVAVSWVSVALMVVVIAMFAVIYVVEVSTEVNANVMQQRVASTQQLTAVVGTETARDLKRAALVAQIMGRQDLAVETLRRAVDRHIDAAINAAVATKALELAPGKLDEFKQRVRSLAYSASGIV
jgi:hypothetical protein